MGLCEGNRGNLMQHWTFAKVLNSLPKDNLEKLHLITTHSMAPWAIPRKRERERLCYGVFRAAGKRLINIENPTSYETAWLSLTVDSGLPYPSTAAFVTRLWPAKQISVGLCEFDSKTADEIDGWSSSEEIENHFIHSVLFRGDWRVSIQSPLIWNPAADFLYIELDPMRYSACPQNQRGKNNPANLYPEDLELLLEQLKQNKQKVILQISSFSTQKNNMSLDTQRASIVDILQPHGFIFNGETRVGLQMASFLFTKNLNLNLNNIGDAFATWLDGILH